MCIEESFDSIFKMPNMGRENRPCPKGLRNLWQFLVCECLCFGFIKADDIQFKFKDPGLGEFQHFSFVFCYPAGRLGESGLHENPDYFNIVYNTLFFASHHG